MIRQLTIVAISGVLIASKLSPSLASSYLRFAQDDSGLIKDALRFCLAILLILEANAALGWIWKQDSSGWRSDHEIAVITGGSKGIGAKLVQELVKRGAKVAVLDIEPLSADVSHDVRQSVSFYKCDVTSKESVRQAAEALRADIGSPTLLFNNAGVGNGNTILESTPESLSRIFNVNLISHWYTVQAFLPEMIAMKKGHIISTASMSAFLGLAGMVDYSCTKVALVAFHEGLVQELKHRYHCPQIKSTVAYPNWTRTDMTAPISKQIRKSGSSIVEPEEVARAMINHIVAGKSGHLVLGPKLAQYVRVFPSWLQEAIRDRLANVVTAVVPTNGS
ncbi:NAD(P)-binding protein [Sporormia fimetaria CBS 119925]|uniref:Short-chain dehydrogenase/reductase 3 n=1 Tax=Sporormia fimetaria CBS 119925 TaxID=1340428 RepID=A0A6A6VJK3_9PLEO|nr:NAD(P)-binding protein [Sporormia fimetaria CBS 119925]